MTNNAITKMITCSEFSGFDFDLWASKHMINITNPRKMIAVSCFFDKLLLNDEFINCLFGSRPSAYGSPCGLKEIKNMLKTRLNNVQR